MERVFQVFDKAVFLRTNCEQVNRGFRELVSRPVQSARLRDRWVFEVLRDGPRLLYSEDGLPHLCAAEASWLVYVVHCRINDRVLRSFPGRLLLHAGYASWWGKRFLVAGASGSGKTTLLSKLLLEGASVHCDERVVLEESEVRPVPRRFHLKLTSLLQLPELKSLVRRADACGSLPHGVVLFDPTTLGRDWVADPGGVDAVFLLEPNHQGESSLEEIPGSALAIGLIHQVTNFHARNRPEINRLIQLSARVRGYRLKVGDLDQAVRNVGQALGAEGRLSGTKGSMARRGRVDH